MLVEALNHFTILSSNVEATARFYCSLLDLTEGDRPPFKFPGAWLYIGDHAVLHIIGRLPLPEPRAGAIDHLAFSARDMNAAIDRLDAQGVAFELRRQVGSGIWQLFFHDPDGVKIELDFDPAETLSADHVGRAR